MSTPMKGTDAVSRQTKNVSKRPYRQLGFTLATLPVPGSCSNPSALPSLPQPRPSPAHPMVFSCFPPPALGTLSTLPGMFPLGTRRSLGLLSNGTLCGLDTQQGPFASRTSLLSGITASTASPDYLPNKLQLLPFESCPPGSVPLLSL